MRKGHNRQKWLSHVHGLKSSRNIFQRANAGFDDFVRNTSCLSRADGGKNIVNIDAAHERRSDLQFSPRSVRSELKSVKRKLKFFGGYVRRILDAVRQRLPSKSSETFAVRIVGIQNRGVRRACACAFT